MLKTIRFKTQSVTRWGLKQRNRINDTSSPDGLPRTQVDYMELTR